MFRTLIPAALTSVLVLVPTGSGWAGVDDDPIEMGSTQIPWAIDGRWIVGFGGDTGWIWDANDPEAEPIELEQGPYVQTAAYAVSGDHVVGKGIEPFDTWRTRVLLWDANDPSAEPIALPDDTLDGYNDYYSAPAVYDVDCDGEHIVAQFWCVDCYDAQKTYRSLMWSVADPYADPVVLGGLSGLVSAIDGGRIVGNDPVDGRGLLWDANDPTADPIQFNAGGPLNSAYPTDIDGDRVVGYGGSADGTSRFYVWSAADPTAEPLILAEYTLPDSVSDLRVSGTRVVGGVYVDGVPTIRVWTLDDLDAGAVALSIGGWETAGVTGIDGDHVIGLAYILEPETRRGLLWSLDDTPPALDPVPSTATLWPANHKMVTVVIAANATDGSGSPLALTAEVTSNEAEDAPGEGDGDTASDWTTPVVSSSSGTVTVDLRAERAGNGTGRVYTVTITATDSSGNSSTAASLIRVPHSK
jgi:hypothetical protein